MGRLCLEELGSGASEQERSHFESTERTDRKGAGEEPEPRELREVQELCRRNFVQDHVQKVPGVWNLWRVGP